MACVGPDRLVVRRRTLPESTRRFLKLATPRRRPPFIQRGPTLALSIFRAAKVRGALLFQK
jgi:hypothetical protein